MPITSTNQQNRAVTLDRNVVRCHDSGTGVQPDIAPLTPRRRLVAQPAPKTDDGPITVVDSDTIAALEAIQRRVLWLATNIIHHANHLRPNPDKIKVGGHQASSASIVSILTALYFHHLRSGDRVSIKPHASPAYHSVQYLLGNLDRDYLPTLRAYKGLQAYPSRTKDPDPVDFSTGSVGLGAVAPAFAALAHRYSLAHFGEAASGRFISVIGDAELDEGNVWEAVTEEALSGLGNVLWIIDLNRQSLDRVVPGVRAGRLKALFHAAGWNVIEAKYGDRLQEVYERPGGGALRQRIDDMSNEEYQALIRLDGPALRERLIEGTLTGREDLSKVLTPISDEQLPGIIADLGGHNLVELLRCLQAADAAKDRPSVLFAYTIKGWGLPIAGDPMNHSALLTNNQMEQLRADLKIPDDEWAMFPADSPEGKTVSRSGGAIGSADQIGSACDNRRSDPRFHRRASSERHLHSRSTRARAATAGRAQGRGQPHRHRRSRRGDFDAPGRLDQPRRDLFADRATRLRGRRATTAKVAGESRWTAYRARHL